MNPNTLIECCLNQVKGILDIHVRNLMKIKSGHLHK